MDRIALLENGQVEWQSDDHDFAEVVSYAIHYGVAWVTFAQTSAVDENNEPPFYFPTMEGHVRLRTDNGCFLEYKPSVFIQTFWPFVRQSSWERLDTL